MSDTYKVICNKISDRCHEGCPHSKPHIFNEICKTGYCSLATGYTKCIADIDDALGETSDLYNEINRLDDYFEELIEELK